MKKHLQIAILLALMMFTIGTVFAEVDEWWTEIGASPIPQNADSPLIKAFPSGLIVDWQRKVAVTTGRSAISGPMTVENREKIRRSAESQALKTLIDSIGLVRIDGFTKLSDLFDNNAALKSDVATLIKKTYRIVHEKVYKDEGVLEIAIEFYLAGKAGLGGTVFPRLLSELPSAPSPTPSTSTNEGYTGLIIDASGLGVEGGLCPKIYSEDGREISSLTREKNRSTLITSGMVDYGPATAFTSNETARAGENPLNIIASKRMKSPYGCDIVIASSEAEEMIKANRSGNFLKDLRVVILL